MRVNFFEEFPFEDGNPLRRAEMIDWPATVYLGAWHIDSYRLSKQDLLSFNPLLTAAYWPLLSDTHWISRFSNPKELERIVKDLDRNFFDPVLLDLELPLGKHRSDFFLDNLRFFNRNLKLIRELLAYCGKIVTAEYPLPASETWRRRILETTGTSFPEGNHQRCIMYYSSMLHRRFVPSVKALLEREAAQYGDRLEVGLGCLTTGIQRTEPIITTVQLREDLEFVQSIGVKTVTIFRLAGLTAKYLEVINDFVDRS